MECFLRCYTYLNKGCKWKVCNECKVRFWDDECLLDHPLVDVLWKGALYNYVNRFLDNYWSNIDWVNIAEIDQSFSSIQISLNACRLYPNQEDLMVWGNDPGGFFKVSSMFRSEDKAYSPIWDRVWIKGLTPKINIFFWTMLENKILTLDNFFKKRD